MIVYMPLVATIATLAIVTLALRDNWFRFKSLPASDTPKGIGGWLLFFAIFFVLGILGGVAAAVVAFQDAQEFSNLVAAAGGSDNPVVKDTNALLWADAILLGLWAAFAIFILVMMFQKKRIFPAAFIAALVGRVVYSLSAPLAIMSITDGRFSEAVDGAPLLAGIISLIGWGWYFLVSKRVRNTFVN